MNKPLSKCSTKRSVINLNLEGIQYDIIDTSSFMLHAIFSQYFLPTE